MSYQVFARKYRPQVFDDVLGQEHVVRTLKNAIEQRRLAHAYLFVGPRGTGKTSTARILAKALNCVHGPTVTPCGVCDSCREISQGISLDVLEIDGASNNSVDQVRELRDNVRFAPVRGRYKVYIIDEVHMLTSQAFNALLKTLEEPPEHVIFVFATTEPNRVLPTILSRCQRFDLHRIPARTIAQHLQFIAKSEKVTLSAAAADAIALAAEGGLRDAESMLDQLVAFCGQSIAETDVLEVFGLTSEQVIADLARAILRDDIPAALEIIHSQSEAGKDLSKLLADLLGFFRNLLIYGIDPASLRQELSELGQRALIELQGAAKPDQLLRLIETLAAGEGTMKWTANKKLSLELAVIRGVQGLREVGLAEVLTALEGLQAGEPTAKKEPKAHQFPTRPIAATDPAKSTPSTASIQSSPSTPSIPSTPSAEAADLIPKTLFEPDEPAPDPTPEPTPVDSVDLSTTWARIATQAKQQRPLIENWIKSATPLGLEHGELKLGFPSDRSIAMESLLRPNNRKFIESLAAETLGTSITIRAELRADLESPIAQAETERADPVEQFKNDPSIQKALEIFRAEIDSAS
ncbi:MAG: DNA polymerase III subunit gamma/tau [Verrucomicrobia bacterium]|nr:DNA polymerase III subunit gamma/tau [Verrucomicrobiota bacterium]